MKKLIKQVVGSGFLLHYQALELFAREGDWHARDYMKYVKSLDAWEIDPAFEKKLRDNLPNAEIKITDTFAELRTTSKKFDFVVSDNWMAVFGDHQFCEHFEMFPDIFRILQDKSVLVLNVIPSITARKKKRFPYLLNEEHCTRRSAFYKTAEPKVIPIDHMLPIYADWANQSGFKLARHLVVERSMIHYLALFLTKNTSS